MGYEICFFICLFILIVTVFCAAKYGKGISGWIRVLSVGILLANAALLLPLPLLPTTEDPGFSVALSILGALQTTTLDAAYGDFLAAADIFLNQYSTVFFHAVYMTLLSVLFVLSPIFVGGMVLTFFEGVAQQCKYYVYSRFRDVYYFSELNENSLVLADSISAHTTSLIVFCNVLTDNTLRDEVREREYITLKTNMCGIRFYGHRRLRFFEIAKDITNDIRGTQQLIEKFSGEKYKERVHIFLFTRQPEAEIMMDATDKMGVPVTVINEAITLVYDLLFKMPLYRALQKTGDGKISVMVAGAGDVGLEVVKAAAWCGQMDGVTLDITAVDLNAEFIESVFRMECPELMNGEYDIKFLTADVRTCQFEQTLKEFGQNANYIVVSLGDDDLNIKTALYLRTYYLRNSPDFCREPIICVRVSNSAKHKSMIELTAVNREKLIAKKWDFSSDKAQNYNLYPFGSYQSVYSCEALVDSTLECLAINVNAVYEHTLDPQITTSEILYNYHVNEVNKRSSRANAVHIKYKLYALGYEMLPGCDEKDDTVQAHESLRRKLNAPALLDRLAEIEHSRWNAFQRGQGYRSASIEQAEIYKAYTNGSHIHRRAKLHACICEWKALPQVAEMYDNKMIDYDKELIRNIPAIIGADKSSALNIGGVRYFVSERKDVYETDTFPRVLS